MKRAAAKPAHTPGPWAIQQHVKHGWFVITADGSEVAGALGLKNALLVSTAPELLDSLIYLRDCAESGEHQTAERWAQAQAVIKKATGGTQ